MGITKFSKKPCKMFKSWHIAVIFIFILLTRRNVVPSRPLPPMFNLNHLCKLSSLVPSFLHFRLGEKISDHETSARDAACALDHNTILRKESLSRATICKDRSNRMENRCFWGPKSNDRSTLP